MLVGHRSWRSVVAALLGSCAALSCALPGPATDADGPLTVPPPPRATRPETPRVEEPPVVVTPVPQAARPRPSGGPALTLLLPLDAPDFRPAAEAVRMGFFAAMSTEGSLFDLAVRRTDASDGSVLAAYDAAAEAGTRVIVGPMTRSAVAAIARRGQVALPTLALNQPEGGLPAPPSLYTFSLGVDTEARHIARLAWNDTLRTVAVVNMATSADRRSRDAFVDEWLLLGGTVTEVLEVGPETDPARLRESLERQHPQFVFLAAGGERARLLRPFLGSQTLLYTTSQVNTTDDPLKNIDLNGVRLADMPWLVRQQDPLVVRYPRPAGMDGDLTRFYAFGIDAYRVAAHLLAGERTFALDGVTGKIVALDSGVIERRPIAATFRQGRCVALE